MEISDNRFSLIRPEAMEDINVFDRIKNGWMLITAEHNGRANTMTASWGTLGVLWGRPVISLYVRPQRFTYSLLKESKRFSVSFLGEEYRNAMRICGSLSGRQIDKFKAADLSCAHFGTVPYVYESEQVMICKKLYSDILRKDKFTSSEPLVHYRDNQNDYH